MVLVTVDALRADHLGVYGYPVEMCVQNSTVYALVRDVLYLTRDAGGLLKFIGSLIIAGFPVHIMSSMIPIFLMPIAVLDSIHIISEFFEKYQQTRDRAATMRAVMEALFGPMLYTSLTSSAGFASLALTPIPPVQVFGVFVAMGIMLAWLLKHPSGILPIIGSTTPERIAAAGGALNIPYKREDWYRLLEARTGRAAP